MKKQTKFSIVEKFNYKNKAIGAGFVKNSPHKINTIFLMLGDTIAHLREDEVFAIIDSLTKTLWVDRMFKMDKKSKIKWVCLKELNKSL